NAMSDADRPDFAAPSATFGTTCLARYPGSPSGCTCTPSATSPAIRSIHGFTAATSTFGSVASCSSHAVAAVTNGLRGNATATPVDNSRPGAACDATAAFRYAVRPVSVNNRPENPAACVRRARSPIVSSGCGVVITSTCTVEQYGCARNEGTERVGVSLYS